jgi:hypothetical protein
MKKGEVLFFDNRIIHNSLINKSTEARVAVICGIFPKEASFLTCYKDSEKGDSSIELIKHEENFLLDYDHFFYDCTTRPTSGKVIGTVKEQFPDMTSEVFEGLCKVNNIQPVKQLESLEMTTVNCDLIAEPDGINKFEATKETVNKQPFLKAIFKKLRV